MSVISFCIMVPFFMITCPWRQIKTCLCNTSTIGCTCLWQWQIIVNRSNNHYDKYFALKLFLTLTWYLCISCFGNFTIMVIYYTVSVHVDIICRWYLPISYWIHLMFYLFIPVVPNSISYNNKRSITHKFK